MGVCAIFIHFVKNVYNISIRLSERSRGWVASISTINIEIFTKLILYKTKKRAIKAMYIIFGRTFHSRLIRYTVSRWRFVTERTIDAKQSSLNKKEKQYSRVLIRHTVLLFKVPYPKTKTGPYY